MTMLKVLENAWKEQIKVISLCAQKTFRDVIRFVNIVKILTSSLRPKQSSFKPTKKSKLGGNLFVVI